MKKNLLYNLFVLFSLGALLLSACGGANLNGYATGNFAIAGDTITLKPGAQYCFTAESALKVSDTTSQTFPAGSGIKAVTDVTINLTTNKVEGTFEGVTCNTNLTGATATLPAVIATESATPLAGDPTATLPAVIATESATPVVDACQTQLKTPVAEMSSWLASHFGGSADQWKQKTDQTTGLKLCAWEFLAAARDLGVGPNVILGYGTESNAAEAYGTVSYGVANADNSGWLAGYLTAPGDFTVNQVGSKSATAIDTATWVPTPATADQKAARTGN